MGRSCREPAEIRAVVSSVSFIATEHGAEKWANFPQERARFLELLQRTQAKGVVVISGDRHLAELSLLKVDDGAPYPLYEMTTSGLNQPIAKESEYRSGNPPKGPPNRYRIHERPYTGTNFGLLRVKWDSLHPLLRLEVRGLEGEVVLSQDVASLSTCLSAAADSPQSALRPSVPSGAVEVDVCIYGSTPSGVMAAVQAARMGKSVMIVTPDKHLGGMSSSGLGFADTGNTAVIGGLAREFHQRVWKHYEDPNAWKWQPPEKYGNHGQGTRAKDDEAKTMWVFEPGVAEKVYESYIKEYSIPVYRDEPLDRASGVRKDGAIISQITTLGGKKFAAKMFIDTTYEADLMAAAGVDYHVGREAQGVYDEKWNGVQIGILHHQHHFGVLKQPVSPYVIPGDPKSGVIWGVSAEPPGEYGAGDKKVQAYCYRLCLTDVPENRVPFPKPDGYDASHYELLLRIFATGWRESFKKFDPLPNRKTDVNNHGPMSFDFIGGNHDYPEASYERRREIIRAHQDYQQGWLYFIGNDPRVPSEVRQRMMQWGLPKDEFADNGHWPYQLYIREARRMIGTYVMTGGDMLKQRITPDSVGMGSYTIDSHNVQRYITPDGHVQNEGDIGVPTKGPYQIAYGSLVPKAGQADNLFVTSCLSSSHIAFGSIRMDPVLMILGQSAATAAAMAIDEKIPVQQVSYEKLRARLLTDGQVLEPSMAVGKQK